MKIQSVTFVKGAVDRKSILQNLPEIPVMGRSNVGKSSFLNFMFGMKKMVKTSRTPGKTKELNYFLINEKFYFLDFPGLGYAKISHTQREELGKRIKDYFEYSKQIKGVLYLIDCRVVNSPIDLQAIEWILEKSIPCLVVITKSDKLNKKMLSQAVSKVEKNFQLPERPLVLSSLKGIGKKEVFSQLSLLLKN